MRFFHRFLSIVFPDTCVGCGGRGVLLCASCVAKIPAAHAPEHPSITSLFAYTDFRVRSIVKILKYKNTRHAADIFAPSLAAVLVEFRGEEHWFLGRRPIVLVPIPISKNRKKKRGYNQAELIARAMLAHLPQDMAVLAPHLLSKVHDTKPQADIKKRSERLSNLGNCFRVSDSVRISHESVVMLIDDVTTTGATLAVARGALLRAGWKRVYALTIAH